MQVRYPDLVVQDVHDVRVVPNALGGQGRIAAHLHSVRTVTGGIAREPAIVADPVTPNQRSEANPKIPIALNTCSTLLFMKIRGSKLSSTTAARKVTNSKSEISWSLRQPLTSAFSSAMPLV